MKRYEVAVIGLGTMGSFLAMELALRKASVVGFDQFTPPHHEGSHSGETRVFHTAYYEHPSYPPLAMRSGSLSDRLGDEIGTQLLTRTGLLSMGSEESEIVLGIRRSAALHQIPILSLSSNEISRRYPALRPPDDFMGLLEETAGWIDVDVSLRETLKRAKLLGADLRFQTPVLGWEANTNEVRVKTKVQELVARRLVITAGPWALMLLRDLQLPLEIKRKTLAWFDPLVPEHFREGSLPIFAFATHFFYGFPNIWEKGVKVGLHEGGDIIAAMPVRAVTTQDLDP